MRISIIAAGRSRDRTINALVDDYLSQARQFSRQLGIADIAFTEIDDRGPASDPGRQADLNKRLLAKIPANARLIVLDERGKNLTSREFSAKIDGFRASGDDIAFLIGGADGLDEAIRARASLVLSFGKMTWPHLLVRALLAEQIFRSLTILAGHPYHRD